MTADQFLERVGPRLEAALDDILAPEEQPPSILHRAMRYSVFPGGKRLRPALCLAGFATFRPDWETALPVAAAIEFIHTYSLIHDDLPSMDNDDFRRGRPSCHRQFGEAIAILAGDGLLTLAFDTVARRGNARPERLLGVSKMLGEAVGTVGGMVAGQVLDLEAEEVGADPQGLETIHRAKTGALLSASISIGAYLAEASRTELKSVVEFGQKIGLAFQIVDDLLDETSPVATLGKTPGKDRVQGKATYPAIHGVDASRDLVGRLTSEAEECARSLGPGGGLLAEFALQLEGRVR